ncbi:MAG: dephospho-CoA kinase [Gaiellaceae bacterium]
MRPLALAITGGIGAGKSEALAAFGRRGIPVVSSDEIVHGLLRDDPEIRAAVAERFGTRVLAEDGAVDRTALAEVVFGDAEALAWLEALLHPRVAAAQLDWRERLARLPEPPPVCVTEVPLLYETGGEARFDEVLLISAPEELRAARAGSRAAQRGKRFLPEEEKRRRARFVYVNDGTLEELDAFVGGVLGELADRG